MTVTDAGREALLETYGRWYGQERFAVAFTSTISGENAKRVTSTGWDKAAPLAGGDYGAGLISERGKTRNVAIVLRPSNLLVLECDSEDDLLRIQSFGLPETITVRSSKPYKRHFYFRPSETLTALPYVAFRFESGKLTADSGRYFLAPPSIHPSGAIYAFLPGHGPGEMDIAELSERAYRMLADTARQETDEQRERIHVDPDAKVSAGQRGDSIFRFACMLRRWGMSRDSILEQALQWNEERCEPPIERSRVEMQVDGAMKKRGDQEIARAIANPLADDATVDEFAAEHDSWTPVDDDAAPRKPFSIIPLTQFVATVEELAEPLVGDDDEAMLPAAGNFLMYGDGGAGKTTLTIDAVAHLASGTPWLGMNVPRPLRVIVIENEGPRQPFRNTLERKMEAWQGRPFHDNVAVLEEPWMAFTFDDEHIRALLATAIDDHQADIVVVGPLITIGAAGTGTPDEVNEFDTLVRDLRSRCERNFALWVVHHENKAGDISGAWGRWPDTLVHVVPLGNGRSRITWDKARWASTLHKTSTDLIWADGKGFELATPSRERNLGAEAAVWLEENGNPWSTAKELRVAIKASEDALKKDLDAMTPTIFEHQTGPEGRWATAQCWRLQNLDKQVHPDAEFTPMHKNAPTFALDRAEQLHRVHPHLKDAHEDADAAASRLTASELNADAVPNEDEPRQENPYDEDELNRLLEQYDDQLGED